MGSTDDISTGSPGELPQRRRVRQPFEPAARIPRRARADQGPGAPPRANLDGNRVVPSPFPESAPRRPVRSPFEPVVSSSRRGRAAQGPGAPPADDADVTATSPIPGLSPEGPVRQRLAAFFRAVRAVRAIRVQPLRVRLLRERLLSASPRSRKTVVAAVVAAVTVVAAGAVIAGFVGGGGGPGGQPTASGQGATVFPVPQNAASEGGLASSAGSQPGKPNASHNRASGPATINGQAPSPAAGGGQGPAAKSAASAPPSQGVNQPVASAPGTSAAAPPQAVATAVTGQVTCSSGAAVVGVWVQATTGSGWSTLTAGATASAMAYTFKLPEAESYSVHVGCGGTSASWKIAVYSPFVEGTRNSFTCHDTPGGTDYKTCELV